MLARCSRLFQFDSLSRKENAWIENALDEIPTENKIRLVQSDIAGTLADDGCVAPTLTLKQIFLDEGYILTEEQIVGPMGVSKREHVHYLLMELNGKATVEEVDRLYRKFLKLAPEFVKQHSALTPFAIGALPFLKKQNIPCALTTGYPREIAQPLIDQLRNSTKHYIVADKTASDGATRADLVAANNMELHIAEEDAHRVLFISDTTSDLASVKNHHWKIGVSGSSALFGTTDPKSLPRQTRERLLDEIERAMLKSGAHLTIRDDKDFPRALLTITLANKQGKTPQTTKYLPLISEEEYNKYHARRPKAKL